MNSFIGKSLFIAIIVVISLGIGSHFYYYSPFCPTIKKAVAVIHPTKGNHVSGTVTFFQEGTGVRIYTHLKQLAPGKHGFHIHALGDCACSDATCAGSHFNPTNHNHGGPLSTDRHVGDLGNVVANQDGIVTDEYVDFVISLNGPHSIIGRSVIVHADEDDYISQPTGNAGARIGCGVIGIAE